MPPSLFSTVENAPTPDGTYFASPERLDTTALRDQLDDVTKHPLLNSLLGVVGGLLAVLNTHRQILAINENLLAYLGGDAAGTLLGLRLGEALACPHAKEMAGGCGTSRYCKTCGAALAQAVALHHCKSAERLCALETEHNGTRHDLVLRVRATPLTLDHHQLILVFIDDVTRQQQSALSERAFHHDLNNTLTSLLHASETLAEDARGQVAGLAGEVHRLTHRVVREVQLHRQLVATEFDGLKPERGEVRLSSVLDDLRAQIGHHPAAHAKRIVIVQPREDRTLVTDAALLLRVLDNMAINALEATRQDGEIRIRAEVAPATVEFSVWNEAPIPPEVGLRIFQRNFSTKGALGRGLGTYAMKLVGERLLGGQVAFDSSALDGTTFRFRLPL